MVALQRFINQPQSIQFSTVDYPKVLEEVEISEVRLIGLDLNKVRHFLDTFEC